MTRLTGDSKESSGQVVLRHGPRAQVLREREKKRELEGAYLNSHRTPDKTGVILQIQQTDPNPPTRKLLQHNYWRLRQEGSGDTVAPSDDTPRQGQPGRI